MEKPFYDNSPLAADAGLLHLKVRHIFCGRVTPGRWVSKLPVDRLIYVFDCGREPGGIGNDEDFCPLIPHTWLFIPAFFGVRHEENEGLKLISIHFNVELFADLELLSECDRIVHGIAPEYRERFSSLTDTGSGLRTAAQLHALLFHFLAEMILPEVPPVDHLREKYRRFAALLTVIRQDPRRNLSVARMAEIMKMGKESFVKRFSAEIGSSPKLFFNRIRAAAAAESLCAPETTIRELAFAYGFANEFYFSRFFKRHFGLSPAAYRRRFCRTSRPVSESGWEEAHTGTAARAVQLTKKKGCAVDNGNV